MRKMSVDTMHQVFKSFTLDLYASMTCACWSTIHRFHISVDVEEDHADIPTLIIASPALINAYIPPTPHTTSQGLKMGIPHLLLFVLLFVLNGQGILMEKVDAKNKGERRHSDPELVKDSHHDILGSVMGSKKLASESMVYSYKHGFSGFAAKITESQARRLAELPGVARVMPNTLHKLQTTRSWDYLGLPSNAPNNLIDKSNMGDGVIIGVLDTGIWPESKVLNDEGLGPIPSHWRGACEFGNESNGTSHCNKKLIGARWYIDGFVAEAGQAINVSEYQEYLSPRDAQGHGTQVSSIAAGSYVSNINYKGLSHGTVRGGAPRARLAMYKACWNVFVLGCASADILKAFDDAIHDGVDVLSVSLASPFPLVPEVDAHNPIAIGSFHAVARGITVVCGAGNDGPSAQRVMNTAPWIIAVAASTIDRGFPTSITLGNNKTILVGAIPVYREGKRLYRLGISSKPRNWCLLLMLALADRENISSVVRGAGGVGVIIAKNPFDHIDPCSKDFPCIEVDYEDGTQILSYVLSNRSPIVKLNPAKTHVGNPYYTKVAYFSSRGPNSIAPAILKPDISAPGVNIFAATSPINPLAVDGFLMSSGTSFATPHISGIVALLKAMHPDWSPAAMKSALVTTARNTDRYGLPVFAEGSPRKPADPFDLGGGIANPNDAAHPGLVYDMDKTDYLKYLCAMGYNNSAISHLSEKPTTCPTRRPSILDINLPSITIPSLKNSTTLNRTVTNVGPVDSVYKVAVDPPFGTVVLVRPCVLVFNSTTKRISFKVTVFSTRPMNTEYYFGSLTWINGALAVRSPISVRADVQNLYA
ncbi:hypothetical protein RJ639_030793 [Escallonia herrerae]|uniref:Subtilisin-like protease n=1 Tax=Escallonia herrerae TaxID=1293975 RepID=A0AA88WY89_9ASTE|nr:hypothetical protein RJ639_030793 [Escallonia herrerae]